jgi:hypothetical protein
VPAQALNLHVFQADFGRDLVKAGAIARIALRATIKMRTRKFSKLSTDQKKPTHD